MSDRQVWVCVPTAQREHVNGQLSKWRERGYRIATLVNEALKLEITGPHMNIWTPEYPGVWRSWNILAKAVMAHGADVCVLAGDDMDPDPNHSAQEIAAQFLERFPDGYGVMQPCGDPQGDLIDGWRNAGRICGSPWVGRRWVELAYSGYGPVCDLYSAFYADEELLNLAGNRGVLWRREDLSQFHRHWSWGHLPKRGYHDRNQEQWEKDQQLFEHRRTLPDLLSGRWDKLAWYQKKEPVQA